MNYQLTSREEEILKSATECITKVTNAGVSALNKFPTQHYDLKVFTYINLLERFTVHLQNINFMLKSYSVNPNLETSIGLTIRAGLLDEMTILYLVSYHADVVGPGDPSEAKFNYEFNRVLCDQVNYTFKYLREARDAGFATESEYKAAVEMTFSNYHFLFNDTTVDYIKPELKLISQDTISPVQLFKRIRAHALTTKFAKVYDLYTYYSKYEHFGMMAHFMQRQESNIHLERILGSISYLIHGLGGCLSYLSFPVNLLSTERQAIEKLASEFDQIAGDLQSLPSVSNSLSN